MPIRINPAELTAKVRDESGLVRSVFLASVSAEPSTHEGARLLNGHLNIFEPAKKKYATWQWSSTCHLLPDETYRWNDIILEVPDDQALNNMLVSIFPTTTLKAIMTRAEKTKHTPITLQIALFMINLLTALATEKRELIDRDMTIP